MRCPNPNLLSSLRKNTLVSLAIVALIFGLGSARAISAQETTDQLTLTAIPPRLGDDGSLKASPGETLQTTIRVRNASDQEVNIISLAQDFIVDADGSTPLPISEITPTRWSLASWITVAPSSLTLQPNQVASISVVIEIPKDALPGGKYAMIVHQPTPQKVAPNQVAEYSQSGVSQRVGTLLYVQVNGPINEDAYIRNFNMPEFSEYGPVPFNFSIENLSDIHIQPNLKLEITNMFGKKVADLNLESKNVFPLTQRDFSGKYDQIWGTGKYFATLTMNYGNTGKVAIARVAFWLFPITLAIAALTILLVIIAIFIIVRRHMISRRHDQTKHIQELEAKLKEFQQDNRQSLS